MKVDVVLRYKNFIYILILLLMSCVKSISMKPQDKNIGPCFKNHRINFSNIEWGMKKEDVKRLYVSGFENDHAIEHFMEDGLEFGDDLFDADLIFFFDNDRLFKISILVDVVFDEVSYDLFYNNIKTMLGKMYGRPIQKCNAGNNDIFWMSEFSIVTLHMSMEYYLLRMERTLFGFNPRLSADFYNSPPDKLIRIIIDKK